MFVGRCDCLLCMAAMTKDESVTLRLTKPEKADLEAAATLTGQPPGTLTALYVKEGVRRSRFPAIEFRDGAPGRVAYVTGTRWPVWMVVDLVKDLGGNTSKAGKRLEKPESVVKMALTCERKDETAEHFLPHDFGCSDETRTCAFAASMRLI